MNSFDFQDKLDKYRKYLKYGLLAIPTIIILVIVFKNTGSPYKNIESELEKNALAYVKNNNVVVAGETFVEIDKIMGDLDGIELCSKASGVIVSNTNGKLEAKAYLECPDYKSNVVNNKEKYIELKGDAVVIITAGEVFNDPLYILKKDAGVVISGEVGTEPGIYTKTYKAYVGEELKETLYRKIIVTKNDKTLSISGIESVDVPTITLLGDKNMVVYLNEKYKEPGYKAVDYKDGKISRNVEVTGKVDTTKAGTYTITYKVTNSRGRSISVIRAVKVVARKADLSIDVSVDDQDINKETIVTVTVVGEEFNYLILPTGETSSFRTTTFKARSNGTHVIKVYDIYGNEFIKEVEINNIDNTPPTGTCTATINVSSTKVEVNASDNKGIKGYNYIINGKESGLITDNYYDATVKGESVKVLVEDVASNQTTLTCSIVKNDTLPTPSKGDSRYTVSIKECFGGNQLATKELEDYLMGVLLAEEDPSLSDSFEYVKAFVIFARTYSLRRGGWTKGTTLSLRTCSSDQNWCDYEKGCYRYQTKRMFDLCIEYSLSKVKKAGDKPYYDADTCANRVTTFPGTKNVTKETYQVNNSAWPSSMSTVGNNKRNVSVYKRPATGAKLELLKRAIDETKGLVIKKSDGTLASVGYYVCNNYTSGSIMCPNKAKEMANSDPSLTALDIIKKYTQSYPDIKIEQY